MMSLTLALDAMGGDHGPLVTVPAAMQALLVNTKLKIILVGDKTKIDPIVRSFSSDLSSRIQIIHTSEVVEMSDLPSHALRRCKNSSMRIAIEQVRDGHANACISAGNTGALMALSKVLLKTLPSINRPALISALPTARNSSVYLLDLGANISCDSETLFQFAVMGSVLYEAVENNAKPKVGLLNVGIEENKGSDQVKQAAQYLHYTPDINYVGFIEGDEIYQGNVDVIVCDGFVGNITLKTSEGIARLLMQRIRKNFSGSLFKQFIGKLISPLINKTLNDMHPDKYNGASLIGLRGTVIKSHGNAGEKSFLQAINLAVLEAERNVPEMIKERLETMLLDPDNYHSLDL